MRTATATRHTGAKRGDKARKAAKCKIRRPASTPAKKPRSIVPASANSSKAAGSAAMRGIAPAALNHQSPGPEQCAGLARSSVCRKLPVDVRARVDAAILKRPAKLRTLEAIFAQYKLGEYEVKPAALRAYARRLEAVARPALAGQILAAMFGCLPAAYRRRLAAGTEVLLLSRVVQALYSADAVPLSVAEMSRLGAVLSNLARARAGSRRRGAGSPAWAQRQTNDPAEESRRICKLVRDVYGLSLPQEQAREPHVRPAEEPA